MLFQRHAKNRSRWILGCEQTGVFQVRLVAQRGRVPGPDSGEHDRGDAAESPAFYDTEEVLCGDQPRRRPGRVGDGRRWTAARAAGIGNR